MGRYRTFFTISIHHDYFTDGRCRSLRFIPSSTTARIMHATGLIVRNAENGLALHYEDDRLESLRMYLDDPIEPLRFVFKVASGDPRFFNYTAPDIFLEKRILSFRPRKPDGSDKTSFRLTRNDRASEDDFETLDSPGIKEALSPRDLRLNPHFIVSIAPDPEKNILFNTHGKVVLNHFHTWFRARETYWKYIVIDNHDIGDIHLSDIKKRIAFKRTESRLHHGKGEAVSFISEEPIPLSEAPRHCFQLKTRESGRDRTLIKKVPVAAATVLFKGPSDDRPHYSSEIFINL